MDPLILVLDAGTVAARAVLVSLTGAFIAIEQGELSYEQDTERPRRRSFDPQAQAALLGRLAARCLSRLTRPELSAVQGIAVTGQRSGCVVLDEAGGTLYAGPQFDARGYEVDLSEAFADTDATPPSPLSNAARIAWLREHDPEAFAQARTIVSIPAFFTACLTGSPQLPEVPATASDFAALSLETGRWDARLVERFGLELNQLGTIHDAGQISGALSPNVADSLGLPAGLPVVLAGHGASCAMLGAGATRPGEVVGVLGSMGAVARIQSELEPPKDARLALEPYIVPPLLNVEASCGEVGFLTSWFAQELAPGATWEQLFAEAAQSPAKGPRPRANLGPQLQRPCGKTGERRAGRWVIPRGLPFGRRVTRGMLFRSLLESIAFAIKQALAAVESPLFPERTPLVRLSGALAQAQLIGEVVASVLDRPVSIPDRIEVTSLGAAMVGAVATGLYPSFEDAALAMSAPPRIHEPQRDLVATYEGDFERWLEGAREAP